jgi:lipoprotein signal peptidase
MKEHSHRGLLYTLAFLGLLLDQASKYGIFAWLATVPGGAIPLFQAGPDLGFHLVAQYKTLPDGRLVPHVNHGALFGFMREQEGLANGVFAFVSFAAAAAILIWSFLRGTGRDPWLCAALGLILGGTVGNLYDRLLFNGVRDFLHWHYPEWLDWPVFNFADVCLVVGAGLLLIQAFLHQPATPRTDPQPESLPVATAQKA